MLDLVDFAAASIAILVLLIATIFIATIWSAALGAPLF
jgi:hypothetical protein